MIFNQAFLDIKNFLYIYAVLVTPLIFYSFLLDTVVTCILIISLITGILLVSELILVFESKRLVVFTYLVRIKVLHFLHFQQPFTFEIPETMTVFLRYTNVSGIIMAYLWMIIPLVFLFRGLKKRRMEAYIRLYTYFASRVKRP